MIVSVVLGAVGVPGSITDVQLYGGGGVASAFFSNLEGTSRLVYVSGVVFAFSLLFSFFLGLSFSGSSGIGLQHE